jgi:hypothetical protein
VAEPEIFVIQVFEDADSVEVIETAMLLNEIKKNAQNLRKSSILKAINPAGSIERMADLGLSKNILPFHICERALLVEAKDGNYVFQVDVVNTLNEHVNVTIQVCQKGLAWEESSQEKFLYAGRSSVRNQYEFSVPEANFVVDKNVMLSIFYQGAEYQVTLALTVPQAAVS